MSSAHRSRQGPSALSPCACRGLLCFLLCLLGLAALPAQARGCVGLGCLGPAPDRDGPGGPALPALYEPLPGAPGMGRPGGADPFAPPWAAGPSGTLAGLYLGSAPVAGWRLRTVGAPWRPAGPAAAETRSGGLLEGLRLRWRQGWQLLREVGGTPLRLRLDRAGPQMEAGADEGLKLDLRFGPGRSALVEPRLFLGLHHRW